MTEKKQNEELNEADLDQVTGGADALKIGDIKGDRPVAKSPRTGGSWKVEEAENPH